MVESQHNQVLYSSIFNLTKRGAFLAPPNSYVAHNHEVNTNASENKGN